MSALAITRVTLRRVARDRTALFFMLLLPIAIILVVGTIARGASLRIGTVDLDRTPLARQLVTDLRASSQVEVRAYDDVAAARTAVRRAEIDVAVVVPAGLDATLRSGGTASLTLLGNATSSVTQAARTTVDAAVARHAAALQAAAFASRMAGGTLDANLARARSLAAAGPALTVRVEMVDATSSAFLPQGFSYSAPTMLVLFVFVNSLAFGAMVIATRKHGVYARALAAPVRAGSLVAGETLGYLGIALAQSVIIVAIGGLIFGVSWGNPLAATVLVATWALVGTGTGILAGSLFRTPEQAASVGPAIGIACGMLGGCMWPLAIVPAFMRTLGHVVPHGWAVDAWTTLLSRGGSLGDILTPLGVLAAWALGLLLLSTLLFRRRVAT